MKDEYLTTNFNLSEFTKSDTAVRNCVDNTPSREGIENLRNLCRFVLQPLRGMLGKPIKINSGYRGTALNKLVGGSESSQHCKGQAADIEVDGIPTKELAQSIIYKYNLPFDQIILEFYDEKQGPNSGWVHISYASPEANRRQILTAYKNEQGHTKYKEGL